MPDVDVAVIGAGAAGLSVAAISAGLGLKVALFERGAMGGDCLNTGCVPSKALLAAAHAAAEARRAHRFGIRLPPPGIDWGGVRAHVAGAVAAIAPNDSEERFRAMGVNVVRASARFAAPDIIDAGTHRFHFRRAVIAADGIHSAVRRQLFPNEGGPIYSGVNMWRGVTRWKPFLTGQSYVRAGWLTHGKMVIYPIRNKLDAEGRQLINWVAEIETPDYHQQDWNRRGRLDDFIHAFADWNFDFLDVPGLIRGADAILEYPMVDKDPLTRWSFGRITLLGDAAHPMYPRGSNGAGQAILDARALADSFAAGGDISGVLKAYEDKRLEATAAVVRTNRTTPPDVILKEVYERTGDRPFARLEDVISQEELAALSNSYKKVAGYDKATVAERRRA